MRLSIREKIILPFALLLVLVGVLGTGLATTELTSAASAQFAAGLLHSSLTANQSLSQLDAERTSDLRLATDTVGVPEALAANDLSTLARLLEPVVGNINASSLTLKVLDGQGSVQLDIEQGQGGPALVKPAGQSFSGSPDVMAVLTSTGAAGERRAFTWNGPAGPVLFWVAPMRMPGGQTVGAALIGESISEIARHTPGAVFYTVSGSELASAVANPVVLNAGLLRKIPDGKALQTTQTIGGHTYGALLSSWTMRGRKVGYVAIQAAEDALLAYREQFRLLLTMIFSGAALLTLLIGSATAAFLTRPIYSLVRSMRTVASGDLEHRAPIQSRDEIGFLAKTFNEMTASLQHKSAALEKNIFAAIEALAKAIDARDPMTFGHSERVAAISLHIADAMFMPEKEKEALRRAALLHDLGKIGVADRVLRKPGPLNHLEADEMREHSQIGYDVLKDLPFLKSSLPGVLYHHERWDGGGYPVGLRGTAIPLQVRILSVADVLDAMCSDRPYRQGLSFEAACAAIRNEAGLQFDPDVVMAFLDRKDEIQALIEQMGHQGETQAEPEAA
jgi:HD-GYP domain-containing protein (c-di-GMP phosphodiesterase class II)